MKTLQERNPNHLCKMQETVLPAVPLKFIKSLKELGHRAGTKTQFYRPESEILTRLLVGFAIELNTVAFTMKQTLHCSNR